jgi:hypothetical protein
MAHITILLTEGMTDSPYLKRGYRYYAKGKKDDLLTTNPPYGSYVPLVKSKIFLVFGRNWDIMDACV